MQNSTSMDRTAAFRAPPAKGGIRKKHANSSTEWFKILFLARKQNFGCAYLFLSFYGGVELWH